MGHLGSTYANISSTVALVVALGVGTAYAAEQLPKNSVGAKQIKTGAVKSAEVKDGTIGAADVKDGAIGSAEITDGTIGAADLSAAAYADLKALRAYGVFRANGTLVATRSSTNTTITKIGTGDYCVTPKPGSGIAPEATTIILTPDLTDGAGSDHIATVHLSTQPFQPPGCPGGFNVVTAYESSGEFIKADVAVNFLIP